MKLDEHKDGKNVEFIGFMKRDEPKQTGFFIIMPVPLRAPASSLFRGFFYFYWIFFPY